ncbi:M15 family metallopeptidase [Sorangium sp. So ce1182]|uniref:M15 family metallopeptidase n=1 Tax=Sorangium sp. So ce1182 TaxID=3133334 RepID=UPI003F5EBB86
MRSDEQLHGRSSGQSTSPERRLWTGRAVEMPGRFDEMSLRSYPDFIGGTSRQRALRDLLRREMEAEGFAVYPQEWWQFDHRDWAEYGIGNISFTELAPDCRPEAATTPLTYRAGAAPGLPHGRCGLRSPGGPWDTGSCCS